MMKSNEYRKNHISFIWEEIIKSIKGLFIFLVLSFANLDEGGIYVIIILILLGVISSILKWVTIKFYINNNELIYISGIINRRKLEIPFDKINTIDINKNIIDRIFNVCTLKVDTGAVKEVGQEIKIKIYNEEAYKIRNFINGINSKRVYEDLKEIQYSKNKVFSKTISFKEIFLYSISKSKILWAVGGIFFIGDFLKNLEETFKFSITNNIVENVEVERFFSTGLVKSIGILILLFMFIYIFISIIFMIFEMIRLYNFTLTDDKNDIKIKYGLLTVKEYSIPRNKIYAIRYKQNLLQQLFKIFQIEVVTVGYGDEQNEQAILYPVANKEFINSTLKLILPTFKFNGEINKPTKDVISRFIIKRSIILIIFVIIPLFFVVPKSYLIIKLILFFILFLFNIFLGLLNYKNTSLGISKELLVASSGSIEKITTLVKQEYLQSVEIRENPFQRKKSICDYKLDIYSNKMGDAVFIKNMKRILLNTIDENLIL
ncbi:PH domain-containing protein [Clostridium sp.]|uniref:PH domain-containing protein n=1 Tax=Clostridium sp. TaxID=1506 RepID=UPI0025BB4E29|nr:PH domain-containing protein [Clostridium sp.]